MVCEERQRRTPWEIALGFADRACEEAEKEALEVAKGRVFHVVAVAMMHGLLEETEVVSVDSAGREIREIKPILRIGLVADGVTDVIFCANSLGRAFVGQLSAPVGLSTEPKSMLTIKLLADVPDEWYGNNIENVIKARRRRSSELSQAHAHDPRPKA